MANWCLPKPIAEAFQKAILNGTLARDRLMGMTSDERRAEFAKIVGDENAREINTQFERTLLLKDIKRGYMNWANKLTGVSEPVRRDILAQIGKLDRVLNPAEERAFLSDLAARKLGVTVTADEAKQIFDLSQRAEQLRAAITARTGDYAEGWTKESGTAFGQAQLALQDKINELKPHGATFQNRALQVLSLTREAETSILHWSAPFVQLVGMIGTKEWWQGLGKMFQYFASEGNYRELEAYMLGHPYYQLAKDAKLGITQLGDKLTNAEETLQSHLLLDANTWLAESTGVANLIRGAPAWVRTPLAGDANLIRGWQRSFVGVCNYVRFERFANLVDAARAVGEDISLGSKTVHDLAQVVNNFTGRAEEINGPTGKLAIQAKQATLLNTIFYSPRKLAATMEMFNPIFYAQLSPVARGAAIRQLSGFLLATGTTIMLARFMGAQVNLDPRSSDFAKINIAGEKLDITGGNSSYLRFLARMITGQSISQSGKLSQLDTGQQGQSRGDVLVNFLKGRLAPNAAVIADAMYGHDPIGRPFSITNELRDRLMPIVIDSFIKDVGNNPDWAVSALPAMTALLGVGLESPEPPLSQSGRDAFGARIPRTDAFWGTSSPDWKNDPVVRETRQLGVQLRPVGDKIHGVKLNAQQLDDYARLGGGLVHARLEQLVAMPNWSAATPDAKRGAIQTVIRQQHNIAARIVMAQSLGTENDIAKQATDAKIARNAGRQALMADVQ